MTPYKSNTSNVARTLDKKKIECVQRWLFYTSFCPKDISDRRSAAHVHPTTLLQRVCPDHNALKRRRFRVWDLLFQQTKMNTKSPLVRNLWRSSIRSSKEIAENATTAYFYRGLISCCAKPESLFSANKSKVCKTITESRRTHQSRSQFLRNPS